VELRQTEHQSSHTLPHMAGEVQPQNFQRFVVRAELIKKVMLPDAVSINAAYGEFGQFLCGSSQMSDTLLQ
jgi:hypothetical protein